MRRNAVSLDLVKVISSRDVQFACITGLTAGVIGWGVLVYLHQSLFGVSPMWLVAIIPVCWIAGIQFGYFLGTRLSFFDQFGKYAAIGFTNFAVDAGMFNLLIALTHINTGPGYAAQKGLSFLVSVTHSYFWNRSWSFQKTGTEIVRSPREEYLKFMTINIVAALVNVGVATLVVTVIQYPASWTPEVWANIGAIAGSASALIFNFIGFKVFVFR